MAYINAITSGNFARLLIRVNDGTDPVVSDFLTTGSGTPVLHTVNADTLDVPALQDITITNSPNTFRWRQLDTASEKVISTVSTNSVAGNFVLDPDTFFGVGGGTAADDKGIFNLANEKTAVDILVAFEGISSGDQIIVAKGYITNIAPAVSADAPVWQSPITIEVDGDYAHSTLGDTV